MKIMKNNLSTPLPNLQPQPADWDPHVRGRKRFQTFFTPTHVPQNHERDEAVILSRICWGPGTTPSCLPLEPPGPPTHPL